MAAFPDSPHSFLFPSSGTGVGLEVYCFSYILVFPELIFLPLSSPSILMRVRIEERAFLSSRCVARRGAGTGIFRHDFPPLSFEGIQCRLSLLPHSHTLSIPESRRAFFFLLCNSAMEPMPAFCRSLLPPFSGEGDRFLPGIRPQRRGVHL